MTAHTTQEGTGMKLGNVYGSQATIRKIVGFGLPPKIAYSVLKYSRKFDAEYSVIDQQRVQLIREIAGTKEGEDAKVEPGTPEFVTFAAKFNLIMDTDSDLAPSDMKLSELLSAIELDESNVLSAQDLAVLEVFFTTDKE